MGEGKLAICDEADFGFGWIAPEPPRLQRASHALAAGGRFWLVDPVDAPGLEECLQPLGEPAGVIQLLDRHARDCAALAERLQVPHYRVPFGGVSDAPFEVRKVMSVPGWREVALWWEDESVLVCTEALGTVPYFHARDEPLGVHPFLRIHQPRGLRDMANRLIPEHILVGHGHGVHGGDAAPALRRAVQGARRSAPRWLRDQLSGTRKEKR
jgi:hypothetical protein